MEAGSGPGCSFWHCEGSRSCFTETLVTQEQLSQVTQWHMLVNPSLYKWPPGECWNNLMVNVSGLQRRHTDENTSTQLGHSSCRNTWCLRRSHWEAEPGRAASASLLHLPQSIRGHPSLVSLLSALDSFSKCSESPWYWEKQDWSLLHGSPVLWERGSHTTAVASTHRIYFPSARDEMPRQVTTEDS